MTKSAGRTSRLTSLDGLELRNVKAKAVTYRGRRALKLWEHFEGAPGGECLATLSDSTFKDGVIEAEVAGVAHGDALEFSRGFVGIAFRVQPDGSAFECFFLRPLNGRANDQLRRNHSTQYVSLPDYPWDRLRRESPGVFESYADLVPGAWTQIKIVVSGVRAQLYVDGARQPCLVVNGLLHGESEGRIALWVGSGTDAYFSKVIAR